MTVLKNIAILAAALFIAVLSSNLTVTASAAPSQILPLDIQQ